MSGEGHFISVNLCYNLPMHNKLLIPKIVLVLVTLLFGAALFFASLVALLSENPQVSDGVVMQIVFTIVVFIPTFIIVGVMTFVMKHFLPKINPFIIALPFVSCIFYYHNLSWGNWCYYIVTMVLWVGYIYGIYEVFIPEKKSVPVLVDDLLSD